MGLCRLETHWLRCLLLEHWQVWEQPQQLGFIRNKSDCLNNHDGSKEPRTKARLNNNVPRLHKVTQDWER